MTIQDKDLAGSDVRILTASATGVIGAGSLSSSPIAIPMWMKFSFTYLDFTDAALVQTASLLSLIAGGSIEGVQVFETAIFAGPGLGLCNVSCGDPSAIDSLTPAWDLFAAYDAARIQRLPLDVIYSQAATTALTVTLTADINLNLLTAGAFSVWLKISKVV
jgi:hypothetical protein